MDRDPADEYPHDATGDGTAAVGSTAAGSETWSFDFAAADGSLGGWVRVTRHAGHSWYQAMLAGPHRQLLSVIDHHVPQRSSPLEVRTTDLWADHVCETPFDHWTLGLEAFALGVDDPLELHGRQLGDRVPLGLDLEWETDGPVLEPPRAPGVARYEVPCRVHGEVLVGADVIDFEGVGARDHQWGAIDWWADDGWHLSGMVEGHLRCSVDHRDGATTALVVDTEGRIERRTVDAHLELDDDGLPVAAGVDDPVLAMRSEILAVTPLPIVDGERSARRPRALCRHRLADGRIGIGWIEVRGDRIGALDAGD